MVSYLRGMNIRRLDKGTGCVRKLRLLYCCGFPNHLALPTSSMRESAQNSLLPECSLSPMLYLEGSPLSIIFSLREALYRCLPRFPLHRSYLSLPQPVVFFVQLSFRHAPVASTMWHNCQRLLYTLDMQLDLDLAVGYGPYSVRAHVSQRAGLHTCTTRLLSADG